MIVRYKTLYQEGSVASAKVPSFQALQMHTASSSLVYITVLV